jgi:hypothetical protein
MAITNWNNERPMPSVAFVAEQFDQPDRPPIDKGFGEASSYSVPPQSTDGAAIDRNVKLARVESGPAQSHSTASDRFGDGSPDRHVV